MIALAVAGSVPASAWSACLPNVTASNDDPFAYMVSVVNSLGWAKEGLADHGKKAASSTDLLFNMKSAREKYSCAGKTLAPFLDSKSDSIKRTAEAVVAAYDNIRVASELAEAELVALLDQASAGQTPGVGTRAQELATIRQNQDAAWNDLLPAVALTTYALVKYDEGKPTGRLRITKAQRQALKHQLEETFGLSVRKGMLVGQSYLRAAAGGLYTFLDNPKWRASDAT